MQNNPNLTPNYTIFTQSTEFFTEKITQIQPIFHLIFTQFKRNLQKFTQILINFWFDSKHEKASIFNPNSTQILPNIHQKVSYFYLIYPCFS